MRRLLDWCATPIVMLVVGLGIYAMANTYYHNSVIVYGPDAEDILAPLFYDISRAIHEHGLLAGMYNPGQFAGLSLWNTPYFHPLYPFYFNWLGTDASIFDTVVRLRLVNLLHLAVYGSGCYLLCRGIGVRQTLAVVVGLTSPWLPAVQSMLYWPQILASFAWVPWILACQMWLYQEHSRRLHITATFGLALTFSLLVYAQPAQSMVLVVVGSGIVWLYMAVSAWRSNQSHERQAMVRTTIYLGVAGVLALLACGEYLLSVVTYLCKAIRWLGDMGTLTGNRRMPLRAMKEYALHWHDLVGLLVYRREHTVIIGNLYVGAAVVSGAILGPLVSRDDRRIKALLISALVTMLFCFGIFTPLLRWLPVANKVREVNWWSCYTVTVMFVLGGYGLQRLFDACSVGGFDRHLGIFVRWLLPVVFIATALLILAMHAEQAMATILSLSICFAVLALCLLLPALTCKVHQPAALVIILSAIVPVLSYTRFAPTQPLLLDAQHVQIRNEARRVVANIPDGGSYRFEVSSEIPNYRDFTVTLVNQGMRGISGNESPQEYNKFRLLFFSTSMVHDLYGVKYTVIPSHDRVAGDMPIDDKISLHIDPHALPRLFFVQGGVKVVASPIDVLLQVTGDDVAPFFVAPKDLPAGIDFSLYERGAAAVEPVQVGVGDAVDIKGSFVTNEAVLLILNEDPAGRWRAVIDGKPVESFRINGFQTAFPVTGSGRHVVEIRRPTHLL